MAGTNATAQPVQRQLSADELRCQGALELTFRCHTLITRIMCRSSRETSNSIKMVSCLRRSCSRTSAILHLCGSRPLSTSQAPVVIVRKVSGALRLARDANIEGATGALIQPTTTVCFCIYVLVCAESEDSQSHVLRTSSTTPPYCTILNLGGDREGQET